jgi:hypothetical protein
VSNGGSYIKQINTKEIEKLINIIYSNQPENIKVINNEDDKHKEIIQYVDNLKKLKISFWNKIK